MMCRSSSSIPILPAVRERLGALTRDYRVLRAPVLIACSFFARHHAPRESVFGRWWPSNAVA